MEYYIHLTILVMLYMILAQSFNVSFGLGRLFNLAHVASYALGAYTVGLLAPPGTKTVSLGFTMLTYDGGYSTVECLFLSMVVGGVLAALVAGISTRLSHDYFAIGTIAFAAIVSSLLMNWKELTRGVLGIPGIPRPAFYGYELVENTDFLLFIAVILLLVQFFLWVLFYGRFARSLQAQSENDQAARSLGINAAQLRLSAFVVSSALAGLAGAIFSYYINYIDPTSFTLTEMIFVMTIVVVGRPGSYVGVLGSSVFLVLLPEPLRFIDFSPGVLGPMRQLLYGAILFLVVAWQRDKLFPVQREV